MSKMKTPKEEVKPSSAWWCENCNSPEMTNPEMLAHLKEVHKLETKGLKCSKKMLMHLDSADSYHSTYAVTILGSDVELTNATCNPRRKNDMFRHEG